MKKILSIILMLSLLCSVAVLATSAGAADIPVLNSYDVIEDFEDYKVEYKALEKQPLLKQDGSKGDFIVHREYTSDTIQVIEDTTGSGRGKVMHIKNNGDAKGTYASASYVNSDPTNQLVAHNFSVTFDVYVISGFGVASPWFGFSGRLKDPGVSYINTFCVQAVVQNGKGVSSDTLRNGKTATAEDIYYQFRPAIALNTNSQTGLKSESAINKDFTNWYKTEGGPVENTWYNIKVEMRETYVAMFMKEDGAEEYVCVGIAYYEDVNNQVYAGTFSFNQCAGEFYYDNIVFKSEDTAAISTECETVGSYEDGNVSIPKTVGTGYAMQKTAGNDTDVELIMSGYDGYTFGRWYTDEAMTTPITPVSITLQRYTEDPNYGKFEWLDVLDEEAQISTYEDMEAEIEINGKKVIWNEYYAGSKYRLVVRANTATDGFDYYGKFIKQKFTITVDNDGNGTVSIDGFTDIGDGVLQSRLEIDQSAVMIATPSAGQKFAGWYEQIEVDGEIYVKRISTDAEFVYEHKAVNAVNIIATFVGIGEDKFTVNITPLMTSPGEHVYGTVVAGFGDFFNGEEITLIATENKGYSFLGFYVEEYDPEDPEKTLLTSPVEDVYLYIPYTVTGNVNILAVYEIETYRVRITDGLGGEERIEVVQAGSDITITAAPAPAGYVFSGWIVTNADYEMSVANRTATFKANHRNILALARYTAVSNTVRVSYSNKDVVKATVKNLGGSAVNRYGDEILVTPELLQEGYCVASYTVRGADATINEDGTLSFIMGDEPVTIRIDVTTIDVIYPSNEITMYVVFLFVGLLIVFALLFANNKDKQRERQ